MSRGLSSILDLEARKERAEGARALRNKRREQEEVDELVHRMSTELGRRSVARQLEDSGVYDESWHANNAQMAKNEGQRSLGVRLRKLVRLHCPEQFKLMEKESLDAERLWRIESEQEGTSDG